MVSVPLSGSTRNKARTNREAFWKNPRQRFPMSG